jgi:hypothetical protein
VALACNRSANGYIIACLLRCHVEIAGGYA